MKIQSLALLLVAVAPLASQAQTSPWLPIPGQASLSLGYSKQSANTAYIGDANIAVKDITGGGASSYQRTNTTLRFDYGLSDAIAFDVTLANSKVEVGGADNDSGTADSLLGARWRVLDEYEQSGLPTVTLRGGAIIKGNYDGARLASIGKGASGYEFGVSVGKQITPAFALWGEVSVQNRDNNVPNSLLIAVAGKYSLTPQWSVGLGVSSKKFDGSLDIGGPGFSPAKFQQVREERSLVNLSVGYAFAANQGLSLNLGQVNSGRNTVKDDQLVGLTYTFAFN